MKSIVVLLITICIYLSNIDKVESIFARGKARDALNIFSHTPNDIKKDVQNVGDTAKSIFEDGKDFNIEKVDRVPVPQLVKNEGYPIESHSVTTEDGYILTIHRIPHGNTNKQKNKVVLLQHGLLAASSDWVLFGPNHGLAYILADAGYDVWMGNFRGNVYSRKHKTHSPDGILFWGFSWHEMGTKDLPAMIDYILDATDEDNLYYVGHGQGNTAFYVMASEKPAYNKKVKAQISLAPVGYMGNLFSPILRLIAAKAAGTESLFQLLGNMEFMPNSGILDSLTDTVCSAGIGKALCKNALFAVSGFSPKQLNASSMPLITAHYPAGSSSKQVLHYVQEINSRRFCQFDYGPLNMLHYKSLLAPAYKMNNVATPVIFIYSPHDWLAAETDVLKLFQELGNGKEKFRIPQIWNNLDFVFGNDAPSVVYNKVVEYLAKY